MAKNLRLTVNDKLSGVIKCPHLLYIIRNNVKMMSELIFLYNIMVYYKIYDYNNSSHVALFAYIRRLPVSQKFNNYFLVTGYRTIFPYNTKAKNSLVYNKNLLSMSNTFVREYCLLNKVEEKPQIITKQHVPFILFDEDRPMTSPQPYSKLLAKLQKDPKAYIPELHEDWVYSDANWSSQDAHL